MSSNEDTVSAEVRLRLVAPEQTAVPLAADLFYSREDPYAIRIAIHIGLDEPVEWTFARDLLSMGLKSREGIGDVQMWPSADSEGGEPGGVLNIELSSPFGQAHLKAPASQVSDFLRQAYRIVPAGEESDHIDVAAELYDLLRQMLCAHDPPARARPTWAPGSAVFGVSGSLAFIEESPG